MLSSLIFTLKIDEINKYTLNVMVFLLHPINVEIAEPIWPKFFVGPHMTQGRFMDDFEFMQQRK